MKKNIFYFILGVVFISFISATSKESVKISSSTWVGSGTGYELYKHSDNGNIIYVAKSTDVYPVSITK